MPRDPSIRTRRILFLDDDETRAASFLGEHPGSTWVASAGACIDRLTAEDWDEVSLDHDLGGPDRESGMAVVSWLSESVRPGLKATRFLVHSRDRNAAVAMVAQLRLSGFDAEHRPFRRKREEEVSLGHRQARRTAPGIAVNATSQWASELVILLMACLSPWAFGAVDAWAELALGLGLMILAILGLFPGDRRVRIRGLVSLPSLAIGGLALMATLQSLPISPGALKALSPSSRWFREGLTPSISQAVIGDPRPAIAPPATTLSIDPEASLHVAIQLASAWILLQATIGLGGGPGSLRRFGLAMSVNGAFLALFSIAQSLAWSGKIYGIRPSPITIGWFTGGPFVCHNHLAASLNLSLGFAIGLLLGRVREGAGRSIGLASRAWQIYVVALILAGVLASHSRGGFLAMLAALALTFGLSRTGSSRLRLGFVGVAATVSILLMAVGSASPIERLGTILDSASNGFNGRSEVWAAALEAARIDPFLGTGLGSFSTATAPFFERDRGVFFSHAENEFLQMLVEGGVIGLGLGLLALGSIARLGWRALGSTFSTRDRAAVIGGLFGLLALAVQSLGDFPIHIPGISVAAVVLCGHLCRLGLKSGEIVEPNQLGSRSLIGISLIVGLSTVALAAVILDHDRDRSKAETEVVAGGFPRPDASAPAIGVFPRGLDLDRGRLALMKALESRPDWYEGHLRLGITLLGLYEQSASDWLKKAAQDPGTAAVMADPLHLHRVVHAQKIEGLDIETGPLSLDPVRLYLVPATRAFLEARRCRPASALPHAALGSLDFLVRNGESTSIHVSRAIRLAGADGRCLGLAARAWRRSIATGLSDRDFDDLSASLAEFLPADRILDGVLVDSGRDTLRFAIRRLGEPADEATRKQFLTTALDRIAAQRDLSSSERAWCLGETFAWLGNRRSARANLTKAVEAEPSRADWREVYVAWLLAWGDLDEAHRLARLGLAIDPRRRDARKTLEATAEALANAPPRR